MGARDVVVTVLRRAIGIYFREIEVVGAPPQDTRARLFAANHANGLVDPLLVLTNAPFPIAPIAKSTLWKVPVLRWLLQIAEAVPVVRRRDDPTKAAGSNDEVFDKVAAHFARGGNILIFPEGTSHNEPHLVAMRSGPGRMLARAKQLGAVGLTFQAVALEFDARDTFRSRALVLFGPVRKVDDLDVEGEPLVTAIMDAVRDDLSELVVEGATWEDRLLIARVGEMLAHDAGERSLAAWNDIGRQVEAARKALGDQTHPIYQRVSTAVNDYHAALAECGLTEAQLVLEGFTFHTPRVMRALWLLLIAPLAAVGMLLYFVPYQIPRLASVVAKGERDEVSTYKLGIGLLIFPAWAIAAIVVSLLRLRLPLAIAAIAVILASPFAALAWLDRFDRIRAAFSVLPVAARGSERVARARGARTAAMAVIAEARAALAHPAEDASAISAARAE